MESIYNKNMDETLIKEKIDYINNLTREEVVQIAQKYLNKSQRTRGYILPETKGGGQQ